MKNIKDEILSDAIKTAIRQEEEIQFLKIVISVLIIMLLAMAWVII